MKVIETERIYCIEITMRQMHKILDRDEAVERSIQRNPSFEHRYPGTLLNRLIKIDGVREVQHDPMFGTTVNVRVESEDPQAMAITLEKVQKEIAKYVR